MKNSALILLSLLFCGLLNAQTLAPNQGALDKPTTWTEKDLIQPSELASILTNPKAKQPVIFNIGVVDNILGARKLGGSSESKNLEKLKHNLKELPARTFLVIYCGCCPFAKCPNIRPALTLVKNMGFPNAKLLDLPVNLKQNWINMGYPMSQSPASAEF